MTTDDTSTVPVGEREVIVAAHDVHKRFGKVEVKKFSIPQAKFVSVSTGKMSSPGTRVSRSPIISSRRLA